MSKVSMDSIKKNVKRTSPAHDTLIEPIGHVNVHDDVDDDVNKNGNVHDNVNVDVNVNVIKRPKRQKFEDKFSRSTFYIENDLLRKLNQLSADEKGEKTRLINEALRSYLYTQT